MQQPPTTLPKTWQVPEVLRARLGDGPGRQRAMLHDGHLLIVLHDVPGKRQRLRNGHFFWRQPSGEWKSTVAGHAAQAFDTFLATYAAAIQRLTTLYETADESADYFEIQAELSPIVRSSRNLHAALDDARKMCPEDRELINSRDEAYELMRSAELLHDDAESALDFDIARQAEAQARSSHQMAVSSHRLNVLAAFFFPLATLSAFFGTNLTNGIEKWDKAHPALMLILMLGSAVVIGMILSWLITKPAKLPDLKPMIKGKRNGT
jgi:hypothetical protein